MKNSTTALMMCIVLLIVSFISDDKIILLGIWMFSATFLVLKQLEENNKNK